MAAKLHLVNRYEVSQLDMNSVSGVIAALAGFIMATRLLLRELRNWRKAPSQKRKLDEPR